MNAVNATSPPTRPVIQVSTAQPPPNGETPSLLADPVPGSLAGTDPLSMLYLFESKDRDLGVQDGTKRIEALQSERHQALTEEQQAIQQAIDAENNGSFWDSLGSICGEIAKVAGVIASVAAAVATMGAATPIAAVAIAGAVLSSASFADSELHVLRAFGVDDSTASLVDTGLSLGGAALSVGAGFLAGAQVASSTPSVVDRASAVVAGAGEIGKGAATIEKGEAQASSDQAAADSVVAQAQSELVARRMQVAVDDTQSSDQQSERILETITTAKTTQNDISLGAAMAVRG